MKAIMVMFDSLNRHMLPPYGCAWTHAPNFARLASRTVTFERAYVCSMPCIPARREIHTGRPNFLHRSWGPLEPFDDSMPEMLKKAGVHTHLATDHYHYLEDGGATYHNRYSTWECFRGQEGDAWKGQVGTIQIPECVSGRSGASWRQDWVNRQSMTQECDQPQAKTFEAGLDFIRRNAAEDRWFLQLETFDPHEPFFSQQAYKDLYPNNYSGRHFDWPPYRGVTESPEEVDHCRYEYAALLSMCDKHLGKVLDVMDELNLWKDTMLIVCTDHGFMLGEHECWAKCWQPFYDEISHVPLFIWDPRSRVVAQRRQSLVQTIDFAPTLLEFFGLEPTADMLGHSLRETIVRDAPMRQAGLFGIHGGQVNVIDGRYVYWRGPARDPANQMIYDYTLMPTHMRNPFGVEELRDNIELAEPFKFTKGCRTMRIRCGAPGSRQNGSNVSTRLYDLESDPHQKTPLGDRAAEARMIDYLVRLMKECDAPPEQFARLGL